MIGEWQSLWIIKLGPAEAQEWVMSVTKYTQKLWFKFVVSELVVGSGEPDTYYTDIWSFN